MANLPEKVLSWLYSVLHEYHDPRRTYSDAVRTLTSYPTLTPRTEIYTYESGASALLLTISGTLPVAFRGTTYRFPVKLWVPQSYPQEAPMAYVTPGKDMIVRPGQHVGVDGRLYHPYLRDWSSMWDRASIAELLAFLQQVFAKEPPVISKAQQQQLQRPIGQAAQPPKSPGAPQLPPKQAIAPGLQNPGPVPLPPPKIGETSSLPLRTSSRDLARDGPPLPPLPHERSASGPSRDNEFGPTIPIDMSNEGRAGHIGRPFGQPLPPNRDGPQHPYTQRSHEFERSPVSPVSPVNGFSELPEHRFGQATPAFNQQHPRLQPQGVRAQPQPQPQQLPLPLPQPQRQAPAYHAQPQPQQQAGGQLHSQPDWQHQHQQQQPQTSAQQHLQQIPNQHQRVAHPHQRQQPQQTHARPPPPDLLSDPFDVAIAGTSPAAGRQPAPPIPPNPEKEHLLQALSTTLTQRANQKVQQNLSAIAPLQAQQTALRAAHERLQIETQSLEGLEAVLASNETILHRSLVECDRTIEAAKAKPPPPIDEVLIAPTMVANQLWTLCAEEAACHEAMYVLQTALDRGRVGANDFVRHMRSLGRERFLKMALARKCARGMGLEMGGVT